LLLAAPPAAATVFAVTHTYSAPENGCSGPACEVFVYVAPVQGEGQKQQEQSQDQGQTQEQKTEPDPQTAAGGAGQRSGGGRNAQKSNVDRQRSAQDQLSETRKQRDALQSKANKTPEDKARLQALNRQVKHLQQQATEKSANHSQKGKGQQQ
jgi:hypothetical protein